MSFRIARARLPLRRRDLVGWLALLLVGALALGWGYRRAFPLAPVDWRIGKHEAIRIVEQRIRDLGADVADPYVSAALVADPVLELRLREAARDADPAVLRASRLGEQLQRWRVSVYEGGARVEEWSYLAEVALDGEVVSLLRGTPDAFESAATLDFATARARADRFLAEQGVDLATLAEPVERRVDLGSFSYQFVRYRESAPVLRGILDYGVEVRFAGDELQGFYTWTQDAGGALLQNRLRPATLAQTSRIVVLFLLLPGIAVLFVRRYHQGVMGVRRGVEVFAAIFFAGAVVVAMTARSAADGSNFGGLSRAQVTWVQLAFVLLIYLPALAALGLMSCSIGESACSGSWRSRLAAFDGLWRGRWSNSTVAASALRGVAAGVALAALLQALAAAVPAAGAVPLFALQLGPLWQDAALPVPLGGRAAARARRIAERERQRVGAGDGAADPELDPPRAAAAAQRGRDLPRLPAGERGRRRLLRRAGARGRPARAGGRRRRRPRRVERPGDVDGEVGAGGAGRPSTRLKIHEYQAKEILRRYGVATPRGR
jgi:hypothetical protein